MKIQITCNDIPFFETDSIASGLVFAHALDCFIHGHPLHFYVDGVEFDVRMKG